MCAMLSQTEVLLSSPFMVVSGNGCEVKKKSMKRLTCRKCEGHGLMSILKGHASSCPFNDCKCGTCTSVMSMRANALIRRFRHRQPDQNLAVLKTIRSKNGNMRLRIVPKGQGPQEERGGTTVNYTTDDSSSYSSRRGSACSTISSSTTTNQSSPSTSPPAPSVDFEQLMATTNLFQQLLAAYTNNFASPQSAFTPIIPPQLFLSSMPRLL